MTGVFITIDTELSLGRHLQGLTPRVNLLESVFGVCGDGTLGISHQICRLDAYGLKAVFFVDPMPAQVFGLDLLKRILAPILEAGHEIQLHIHTEWLPYLPFDPVGGRRAANIGSFSYEDQLVLLNMAKELLVAAGAPEPLAFRAGNYGADDNTLRALARLGIRYDTSFNPGYLGDRPRLSLPLSVVEPVLHHGVVEFPISCIADRPGGLRPAQLCALSAWEMRAALRHAAASGQRYFTLVSHSFELLSRDRQRANRTVVERFERLCAFVANPASGLRALTYSQVDPATLGQARPTARLSPNLLRTAHRMGAQLLASIRYERATRRPAPPWPVAPPPATPARARARQRAEARRI
ncbi:polysaccharide deacetylase family protein [Pedomonas mirosovicensis]|uniref:polysaccharide deacetylase family protein n=1 Tax=Pedomonas mirosovicensis TaxID=2908641 RepID=UPI00216A1DAB|nr:hypothetical protein [Pedomonas mirosovicensis]MCH8683873.1 hypothetical protein [Pedomonas mirosovicensis]